jgi:hypothetical protein
MSEVQDFVKQTQKVILQCGKEITVETPTLRWWFEFLIPKQSEIRWQGVSPDLQKKMIAELQAGALSPETVSKVPFNLFQMVLAVVAYYVERSLGHEYGQDWVLDNLDINDGLAVINAWLSVIDVKKAMRFFVQINRQIPVMAMLNPGVTA